MMKNIMGKVVLDKTISLDGFIARPNDDVTRLFAWYGGQPTKALKELGDPLKTSGAVVMGKRSFNIIDNPNGWVMPDGTPLPWPVFVLTHEPQAKVTKGATTFTFVTDGIESAVKQADEIHLHLVPVLLGEGIRLFDHLGTQPIELETMRVIESPVSPICNFAS